MYELEDKIKMISKGKVVNPFQVELHLSNVCNHNCKWCIYKELRQNNLSSIPYNMADKLITELNNSHCETILFSGGGEPLTYSNIENIIYKSYSLKMNNILITNGGLLHKKDLEKLLLSCTNIQISLDAYDNDSHNNVHAPLNPYCDNFDLIYKTIQLMVKINKYGTRITLSYILDEQSIHDLKKFINIATDLNVNAIDVKTQHTLTLQQRKHLSDESKKIISNCDIGNISVCYDEIRRRKEFNNSKWIGLCYKCVIEANGDLYPCCHKIEDEFKIGNVLEEGFNHVWGGKHHMEIIKKYYDKNLCCQPCFDSSDGVVIRRIISKIEKYNL